MENRGTLNWNPNNSTTYTVPAGYYSGGTLNSANAYNAGYTNGVNSAQNKKLQRKQSQTGSYGTTTLTFNNDYSEAYLLVVIKSASNHNVSDYGLPTVTLSSASITDRDGKLTVLEDIKEGGTVHCAVRTLFYKIENVNKDTSFSINWSTTKPDGYNNTTMYLYSM